MGRLSAVKLNGAVAAEYRYNDLGQQIPRKAGGASALNFYDERGQWMGEYDQTGVARQQVIWLDNLPVGLLKGSALYYVQPDHLGTPRVVVDPARDVAVWSWDLKGRRSVQRPQMRILSRTAVCLSLRCASLGSSMKVFLVSTRTTIVTTIRLLDAMCRAIPSELRVALEPTDTPRIRPSSLVTDLV